MKYSHAASPYHKRIFTLNLFKERTCQLSLNKGNSLRIKLPPCVFYAVFK